MDGAKQRQPELEFSRLLGGWNQTRRGGFWLYWVTRSDLHLQRFRRDMDGAKQCTSSSLAIRRLLGGWNQTRRGCAGRSALHLDRANRWQHPESFMRSEEHTSELQSRQYLVCRLL